MEKLKGKTILIGKEPNGTRLAVTLVDGIKKSSTTVGNPGSVPGSVSRNKLDGTTAHASIEVDSSGNMVLTNLKPQNITLVNGLEIESKRITPGVQILLGMDKYSIDLEEIIQAARVLEAKMNAPQQNPFVQGSNPGHPFIQGGQQGPQKEVKTFNIRHLERVWDKYQGGLKDIQNQQRRNGLMQRFPMFFTFGSGALAGVSKFLEWGEWVTYVCLGLTFVGLLMMIFAFYIAKNDDSLETREKLTEEFQDNYCCPNPECNKFLGTQSYKLMKKQTGMKCPYCKSKFVEV